jgi:arylsulfatase A-like enzyme
MMNPPVKFVLVTLALGLAGSQGGLNAAERPPNVVVILADDLGWADPGFAGSDFYETPHLDALRREGLAFTQAYAGAGNCAPSRASLLSGQYTPRHGVYAVGSTDRGPKDAMRVRPVPNRIELAPEIVTLAEALQAAGYATGLFGKWHLDNAEPATKPGAQGFGVFFDSRADRPNLKRDAPDDPKGAFSLTEAAAAFIAENKARPFFAFVSHHAVHSDLEARPASLARFRAKPPGTRHRDPLYAACIFDLDAAVGRLPAQIAALGLERDTLVVFTSDNGGGDGRSQEPLRGGKGCYYEGGLRVPLVLRWSGRIAPGSTCASPVVHLDFYPTFLDLAGGSGPRPPLDGVSLTPVFDGASTLGARPLFWHFPGYLDGPTRRGRDGVFRTRPVSVVRRGDWKLHLFHEEWLLDGGRERLPANRAVELYRLSDDPGEHHDLAATQPAKRDELLGELLAWLQQTRAPMPAVVPR